MSEKNIAYDEIVKYGNLLNNAEPEKNLANLKIALEDCRPPGIQKDYYINNHIHTTFSFSLYEPTMAIWMALRSGLTTAGIMDHDTIRGAEEFMEAGRITGVATTKGVECRVDFSNTPLKGRSINNPDQESIAYVAIHGVPDVSVGSLDAFFEPYRIKRNRRNISMVDNLNEILEPFSICLNYKKDILPVSSYNRGGTVTERHILFSLAKKIMEKFPEGKAVTGFLRDKMGITIPDKNLAYLEDEKNIFYEYDILNVLKSSLVERFYIDAGAECPDVRDIITLAERTGSIPAYAYLGDVIDSVTGDKKPQKFEDDYLEFLFEVIKELRFKAVTYIPTRNTMAQIKRVQGLCEKYGLFQICGEDINSPRQPFVCGILKNKKLHNLVDTAWALIGHERRASIDLEEGLFSERTTRKYPDLGERILVFSEAGKKTKML
ncbi:MAG: PHP domain-containing protein [Actinobacteria bacterium]|nr:PHP domain-containing protein [Actinomycetota bacterium]